MATGRRLLVVFVDALGPDQLKMYDDQLRCVPHTRPLSGVLGYSSGALPTILTGSAPSAHGRMCLFSAREHGAPNILRPLRWLGLLPRFVHERGVVRRRAAQVLRRLERITGYVDLHRVPPDAFEWLDIPEREDMLTASEVGGQKTFLADARDAGLTVYAAPWQISERERWEQARESISRLQPDLAFLYSTELDGALHRGGNQSDEAAQAIAEIGRQIERARDAMGQGGSDVMTLVVGDHGMADVKEFIDPRPVVRDLSGLHFFIDSTMLRFWGDDAELAVARRSTEAAGWRGRWIDALGLRDRDAPVSGYPYGKCLFLLEEGAIFAPSWVGGRIAGMHGYDLSTNSARAALASDVSIPDDCNSLTAVARIARRLLDLD